MGGLVGGVRGRETGGRGRVGLGDLEVRAEEGREEGGTREEDPEDVVDETEGEGVEHVVAV